MELDCPEFIPGDLPFSRNEGPRTRIAGSEQKGMRNYYQK